MDQNHFADNLYHAKITHYKCIDRKTGKKICPRTINLLFLSRQQMSNGQFQQTINDIVSTIQERVFFGARLNRTSLASEISALLRNDGLLFYDSVDRNADKIDLQTATKAEADYIRYRTRFDNFLWFHDPDYSEF